MIESTIGILLAGGRATRMGGGDKSLMRIGGKPLLAHVLERLEPQCSTLILNANGEAGRFAAFGLPVFADDVPGFAGPLAGILAGLDFIAAHYPETNWAISAATDTPFLPIDLVARLHAARRLAGTALACARSGAFVHSVIALWPVALRRDLRHALVVEDIRKADRFMSRHALAYADWGIEHFDPFFNVNTPGDVVEAERIWAAINGATC
ncbi:MAG: molybdenum cofactor guanylyltransferase MobA [Beijerinckiaceae bacterium]